MINTFDSPVSQWMVSPVFTVQKKARLEEAAPVPVFFVAMNAICPRGGYRGPMNWGSKKTHPPCRWQGRATQLVA